MGGFYAALKRACLVAALVSLASAPLASDEFVLKDGRKISGTIVGFENGMFRVQTEFGYALIRKDKVATVTISPSPESKSSEKNPGQASQAARIEPVDTRTEPAERRESTAGPEKSSTPRENHALSPSVAPAPPPSQPVNEPLPAHLQEHIEGNTYFNDTFQFAMFKPPDWKVYEELHREKVSAIVALASQDDQTLLFVDRQVWSGPPDLSDDRVEANLRRTYENYKKLEESRGTVDGREAIRRSFTGVIDGVEWYGVSVRFARGDTVFGIIGLTSAEMYRFQEAIFNKVIKSFHFFGSAPGQGASDQFRPGP